MFVLSLCANYYKKEFLDILNNIPDKSWEAEIPERFKDMSEGEIKSKFSQ